MAPASARAAFTEAIAEATDCGFPVTRISPALADAGSDGGIASVWTSNTRTNVGCFDQSGAPNHVKATILDSTGQQTLGSVDLNLAGHGWGQTAVNTIVSGGYVRFQPDDSAVCYAVVVDNTTNDGRLISAAEYRP